MGTVLKFLKDFKWLIIIFIIVQLFIYLGIPRFVIRFQVHGESMHNTLQNNDLMVGRKYIFDKPEYKDVIVFKAPTGSDFIKRVIGVPGDTISIKDNVVRKNGQVLQEDYIKKPVERIDVDEVKIPEGKYFVMGDNRDNSEDSRYTEVGLVDMSQIKTKIYMRWKPDFKFGY